MAEVVMAMVMVQVVMIIMVVDNQSVMVVANGPMRHYYNHKASTAMVARHTPMTMVQVQVALMQQASSLLCLVMKHM